MKVLVTGGGGFLGNAIVRKLVEQGHEVTSLSRQTYPGLAELGVTQIPADLSDAVEVSQAVEGQDAVIHVAAKAGVWGSYESFFLANVVGTQNVINACRAHYVTRLVFTSSPSVVFDGSDQENWDESAPYPSRYLTAYPQTKAEAEQRVLAANGARLATVALRPHLIWGPGDPHLVPRILARGRAGRIRNVGFKHKLVDSVYVDNAADAHILALNSLEPGSAIAGKAYFITNAEPLTMQALINHILRAGGVAEVHKSVPASLAFALGACLEGLYHLFRIKNEPPMTRFVARQLATSHFYNPKAARLELGYHPQISLAEGFQRLAASLKNQ